MANWRFVSAKPVRSLGLETVEETLARCEARDERWYVAELLRIKGELAILEDAPDAAAAAEGHFLRALDDARLQGALSWELRATVGLARYGEINIELPRRVKF